MITSASAVQKMPLSMRVDWTLFCLWFALMSIGLIMVSSSSVSFAAAIYQDAWFFGKRHFVYMMMGLVLALLVVCVPMSVWQKYSGHLLLIGIFLLVIVLIPGIGKKVNGSQRWFSLGLINVQVSEVAKFCAVIFFASFFARRYQELHFGWQGFLKPLMVVGVFAGLLLLEPDFGATVVLSATVFAMMFIAGVKLLHFILLIGIGVCSLGLVAIVSPYRMQRLVAFLDPWADQFDTGYQLTQSLIGFGRGEWFGLGLGNSLQKLFFLPEAHTDFIFAIIAEEFGLIGALVVIGLFTALIWRIICVAKNNVAAGKMFTALACFGIGILFSLQVFINIGVASGLLPTKGLTLPFISYGGSSLLICCVLIGFVMRAQWELSGYKSSDYEAPAQETKSSRFASTNMEAV
jgi:cell division protein FtsW